MVRNTFRQVGCLVLMLAAATAWAGEADNFSLTRAIPADAFLAVHTRSHDGQAFLKKQFARVWAEVEKQRFDRDLKKIFKAVADENGTAPEAFEANWQKVADLFAGVEWSTLGEREYAFTMKMGFPTPEYVSLMMPPADKIGDDFKGLTQIIKSIVDLAPEELVLAEDGAGDALVQRLTFKSAPFPLGITVARHKDVIMVGFGTAMVEQVLGNLRGEKGGELLSASPRFQEAFKKLPAATDSMTFVDIAKLMQQMRGFMTQMAGMIEKNAGGEEAGEEMQLLKTLPGKIIDELDMFDYVAAVATTDGMKTTSDDLLVLTENAKSKPLYGAFFAGEPLKDPLKYIPKSAGDVSVNSGIDLLAMYKAVVKFVAANIPEGQAHIDEMNQELETNGLSIEKDILGWLGSGIATFSIPGATPMGPGEFAFMLRVRDEAKAREMIAKLMENVEPLLGKQGGAITDAELEGADGFRSITIPMLAMFGLKAPTVGVKDGWLFLAASPETVKMSLDAAAGKVENFSKNERYLAEGVPLGKDVTSISFNDLTSLSDQLGSILMLVPLMTAGNPEINKNPVASAALRAVGKLGNVVRKLDFFRSTASQSTFDGRLVKTRHITNYREPPAPPAAAPAEEKSSGTKAD
ncbi:MAG: hypothetical protein U1D55_06605 [Phycisphaerae bacterium]